MQHQHTSETLEALQKDHDILTKNLQILNNVKNEKEESLSKKIKEYELLMSKYEESIKNLEKTRLILERTQERLTKSEKECDELGIQKESLAKQSEIQRNQLADKIRNLE